MGETLTKKILDSHLVSGKIVPGETVAVSVDQTLFHDATGTMASLQFEALSLPRVKTKLSVAYIDHNTLQVGFENADDHLFLQSIAAKYGLFFSRAGNGICHQVHLERFSIPGKTLLGADSHTPTCGGMGMLAIGVGGLDVALAMAGEPFYLRVPKVVQVNLLGKLSPWVSAKDVILEILRRVTVKGGVGKVLEYGGPGVQDIECSRKGHYYQHGGGIGGDDLSFPQR